MSPLVALTFLILAQGPGPKPDDRPAPAAADLVAAFETTLADAIARAEPSVVAIHRDKGSNPGETRAVRGRRGGPVNEARDRFDLQVRPAPADFVSLDYGSGVVIGDGGEILTAFHVVRGADRLRVHAPGNQSFEAEVIAADPRSDLAVIAPVEVRDVERPRLKPIAIGDSTKLRKGSFLIVLGNHFNAARDDGSASASWGILSNVARRLDPEMRPYGSTRPIAPLQNYPTLLQLDARLNLGMSGGAVINLKGELVGVTTTASSPAGFDAQAGYAIPMDRLGRRIVETLRQGKEMEYGLLGISAEDPRGTRISNVRPNTPAGRGVLQLGDEILAINGTPVSNFDELVLTVGLVSPGEPIKLKIRRSDEVIERTLVLTKAPLDGEVIATTRPRPWRGLRVDFASALGVGDGPMGLEMLGGGVVATDVEEGSPAAAAGLKKGVLIIRVGDRPVQTPRAFAQAVEAQPGDVTLDTDIGVLTVGTADAARPRPAESGRRGR